MLLLSWPFSYLRPWPDYCKFFWRKRPVGFPPSMLLMLMSECAYTWEYFFAALEMSNWSFCTSSLSRKLRFRKRELRIPKGPPFTFRSFSSIGCPTLHCSTASKPTWTSARLSFNLFIKFRPVSFLLTHPMIGLFLISANNRVLLNGGLIIEEHRLGHGWNVNLCYLPFVFALRWKGNECGH